MRGVTHLAGGICAAAIVGNVYNIPFTMLAAGVAVVTVSRIKP